ncbi:MAG: type II toxin-antitoxin system RelE/ParE family toxin [Acidobacteria bacterium]|nr:type II toxin-antitoxin system RelE/ParE family toxin [Acidobacteriota bacterium]
MNSAVPWAVHVDPAVRRQLRRFPGRDAQRITSAITDLAANPYSGDIARMQGEEDVWRRRLGAYRIFYEVLSAERVVHVFRVARRTSTTY